MGTWFELLVIFIMILINGFFSLSEMAIIASRRAKLKNRAEEGLAGYAAVAKLKENPGPFLSTIQIGITLIGILAGAYGGSTVSEPLAKILVQVDFLKEYASLVAIFLVVMGITVASVIFGELIPKRIALNHPEVIASKVIHIMKIVSWIFYPVERVLTITTDFFLWVFRIKASDGPPVTGEEIKVMIQEGRDHGVFHELEQDLVENVLVLDDHSSQGILTPRLEVVYLEKDATMAQVVRTISAYPQFSYFPVCDQGMDHVLGIVEGKKILLDQVHKKNLQLKDYIQEGIFVPFSLSGLDLLKKFQEARAEILFIVDEYGGILGIMTFQDLLERILGQENLPEKTTPQILSLKDGSFRVEGSLSFHEFTEYFDAKPDEDDDNGEYHTFAGFLLRRLGQIPEPGTYFFWKNFYFEIEAMDLNRIDKVLVRKFHHKVEAPQNSE